MIASGFRFEAWLLMAMFAPLLWIKSGWKTAAAFALVSGIFPLIWLWGNYQAHGNPFYSITPSQSWWNKDLSENINPVTLWQRRLFFPLSFIYLVQPILLLLFISAAIYLKKQKKWIAERAVWWIPFLVFFAIWMAKVITGTMFMQHRFTSILILLFAPLIGILALLDYKRKILIPLAFALIGFNIYASFHYREYHLENLIGKDYPIHMALHNFREYGLEQTEALPRLKNG